MATDDRAAALAALRWHLEAGADETIAEAPVDRYAASTEATAAAQPRAGPVASAAPPPSAAEEIDPVRIAEQAAAAAGTLPALEAALAGFAHCDLKQGARHLVFADGRPGARVMIVGEAPGRDEDLEGRPFVGRAGRLLDAMFAAIDMGRDHPDLARALYITNILPWRPPRNRDPEAAEIAMMKPFVNRHVALADPEILVLMGNSSCHAMLGRRGITRLRGTWAEVLGRPCLPMFHPAYLLRNPAAKREAWADLLELQSRLRKEPAP